MTGLRRRIGSGPESAPTQDSCSAALPAAGGRIAKNWLAGPIALYHCIDPVQNPLHDP